MNDELDDIFALGEISSIITALKNKTNVVVPPWELLIKDYEPTEHDILRDTQTLKDKIRKDGTVEKSSRITVKLEQLLVNRITEFTFAIPVKRLYSNIDTDVRRAISKSIEAIYANVHINAENLRRGLAYYASCEIFTIWYAVKKANSLYGFNSNYKLKCKTYSPMNGVKLYPYINDLDDMLAMSFEYTKTIDNKVITVFETYTATKHYVWRRSSGSLGWEAVNNSEGDDIVLLKIPGAYLYRPKPVYHGLTELRKEIEYTLSRNSNVIAYNSAPVIKVAGAIKGQEDKGESYRIWRVENGGDVSYVSWAQSIEALKYHVDTMVKLYWAQAQMPDLSFENMKGLGNIGYDARQTLLTDAHLKVGDESGPFIEFFEREFSVIKSFLKLISSYPEKDIDAVTAEHVITPYIQNDELNDINKRLKANGGKAIESQLESIRKYGQSDDPEKTLEQIQEESRVDAEAEASKFNIENQVV